VILLFQSRWNVKLKIIFFKDFFKALAAATAVLMFSGLTGRIARRRT